MVSTNDDTLDSRDIQERIEELGRQLEEDDEPDEQIADELEMWNALKEETERCGWDDGICFIHEDYMETYARELAEDIGAIGRDADWPATYIDWERATAALLADYSSVEIDGETYYYREA